MRGRWVSGLLAVLMGGVLAVSTATFAAEKKASEKAKVRSATGEVLSVDAMSGVLRVKGRNKEMSFRAESKTAKGALEKVKSGDRVTVSYVEQDGKMVARSVKAAKPLKRTVKPEAKKGKM